MAVFIVFTDVLATTLLPKISKQVVDGFSQTLTQGMMTVVILLAVFWTLEKILHHCQEIVFFPVVNLCIRDIQLEVVSHLHQISFLEYQKLSIPEILSCIKRISQSARSFMKIFFLMLVPSLLKFFVLGCMISQWGGSQGVLFFAIGISFFILYRGTLWYVLQRESAWQITDSVLMKINDSISNTKTIRPFLKEDLDSLRHTLSHEANSWRTSNLKLHSVPILIGLTFGLAFTFILFNTATAVTKNSLTVGDFVMIKAQFIALFLPFKNLSLEFRQLAESIIDIKKIIKILSLPLERSEKNFPLENKFTSIHKLYSKHPLRLENVSFGYSENKLILENVNLTIQENDKIAIIGKNGSGKSSLMGIMSALLKPNQGEIRLFDQNIQHTSMNTLKKIIHMIPQDLRLFNASFRENLSYGLERISEKRIQEVIEVVELENLQKELSKGLNTNLGDFGIRLSGGEKQRLALARALLIKPKILMLDETFHAIALESESALLNALYESIPIVIITSQRPSILQQVNRIFSLEGGKLTEILRTQDSDLLRHPLKFALETSEV